MASVSHVENADGSHSLGVKLDGVFVPLVTVPAERVKQLVAEGKRSASDETPEPEEES